MIKTIYKVEGDDNEYDSEQEAQIAEVLQKLGTIYVRDYERLKIAKAITQHYSLIPIYTTTIITESDIKEVIERVAEEGKEAV